MSLLGVPPEALLQVVAFLHMRDLNALQTSSRGSLASVNPIKTRIIRKYASNDSSNHHPLAQCVSMWNLLFTRYMMISCNSRMFLFDPTAERFIEMAPMSEHRFTRYYYNLNLMGARQVLYVASSLGNKPAAVESLSLIKGEWHSSTTSRHATWSLPNLVGFSSAMVEERYLYITGGYDRSTDTQSNSVFTYDTRTERCACTQLYMTLRRDGHASVVLENKLYLAGGYNDSLGSNTSTVECLDLATAQWLTCAGMLKARYSFSLVVVGGELYAIGGDDMETIERYTPMSDAWTYVTAVKNKRAHAVVCASGDSVFFFGGSSAYMLEEVGWDALDVRSLSWLSATRPDVLRELPTSPCSNGHAVLLEPLSLHALLSD